MADTRRRKKKDGGGTVEMERWKKEGRWGVPATVTWAEKMRRQRIPEEISRKKKREVLSGNEKEVEEGGGRVQK